MGTCWRWYSSYCTSPAVVLRATVTDRGLLSRFSNSLGLVASAVLAGQPKPGRE
jgi:predicted Rdx family selenoprotein